MPFLVCQKNKQCRFTKNIRVTRQKKIILLHLLIKCSIAYLEDQHKNVVFGKEYTKHFSIFFMTDLCNFPFNFYSDIITI